MSRQEKEMATHSSILAWRTPWTEELCGLQSTGRKESDTTERLHFHFYVQRPEGRWSRALKETEEVAWLQRRETEQAHQLKGDLEVHVRSTLFKRTEIDGKVSSGF